MSIRPDWIYDDIEGVLYIHNPIERYQAGIQAYWPHERTENLTMTGSQWVKDYALSRSKLLLGEIFMKFSGAIPSPLQNIQLDAAKRDKAQAELDRLMEQLKGMQRHTPVLID